jgi:hypothetical protein
VWADPLCWRSAEEIALANELDREDDINRCRHIIFAGDELRPLTPWELFSLLYCRRGTVVLDKDLSHAQRQAMSQLGKMLAGSRYEVVNYRGVGYDLVVTLAHGPAAANR